MTIQEQREQWLKSVGITPAGFQRGIDRMIENESATAVRKADKRAQARRRAVKWKHRANSVGAGVIGA